MGIGNKACECCECCTCCLCCIASPIICILLSTLAFILVGLGIAALVLYFVLLPKAPDVTVVGTQLQSFNQTAVASSSSFSQLQGAISVTLDIHNTNRVKLSYQNITTVLSYNTLTLSNTTIPSFTQGSKKTDDKTADVTFDTAIPSSLQSSFTSQYQNGSVPLKLEVNVEGKIKIWGLSSPKTEVTLECDLTVSVFSQTVSDYSCKRTRKYVA